jgi:serine/threonine protein kinase
MGEVYRAYDRVIDRPVAIKILRPELMADRGSMQWLQRFRKETHVSTTAIPAHHSRFATRSLPYRGAFPTRYSNVPEKAAIQKKRRRQLPIFQLRWTGAENQSTTTSNRMACEAVARRAAH